MQTDGLDRLVDRLVCKLDFIDVFLILYSTLYVLECNPRKYRSLW